MDKQRQKHEAAPPEGPTPFCQAWRILPNSPEATPDRLEAQDRHSVAKERLRQYLRDVRSA